MDECQQVETPENYQEAQSIINCLTENMTAWGKSYNMGGDMMLDDFDG